VPNRRGIHAALYYSLRRTARSAAAFAAAARRHWGIEHRVPWVLDVAFHAATCRVRIGHAARNLAVVRQRAVPLLRQNARTGSRATKRFTAALDDTSLTTILAGVPAPPRLVRWDDAIALHGCLLDTAITPSGSHSA